MLNSRVSAIDEGQLTITDSAGQQQSIPFGACCWATGVALHPLVKHLQQQLPAQGHFRHAADMQLMLRVWMRGPHAPRHACL